MQLAAGQPGVVVSSEITPANVSRPSPKPPFPNSDSEKEILIDSDVLNSYAADFDEILINYVGPSQAIAGSGRSGIAIAMANDSRRATDPFFAEPTAAASGVAVNRPVPPSPTIAIMPFSPIKQGNAVLAATATSPVVNTPIHTSGIGIANQNVVPQHPKPPKVTNTGPRRLPIIGQPVGDFNIRIHNKSSPLRNLTPNVLSPATTPINTSNLSIGAVGTGNVTPGLVFGGVSIPAACGDKEKPRNRDMMEAPAGTMAAEEENNDSVSELSMLVVSSSFVQVHTPLLTPCVTRWSRFWHHMSLADPACGTMRVVLSSSHLFACNIGSSGSNIAAADLDVGMQDRLHVTLVLLQWIEPSIDRLMCMTSISLVY